MKLIELREGVCVNIDKIESIESIPTGSRVSLGLSSYDTIFPYATLVQLINSMQDDGKELKEMSNIVKQIGVPAW